MPVHSALSAFYTKTKSQEAKTLNFARNARIAPGECCFFSSNDAVEYMKCYNNSGAEYEAVISRYSFGPRFSRTCITYTHKNTLA